MYAIPLCQSNTTQYSNRMFESVINCLFSIQLENNDICVLQNEQCATIYFLIAEGSSPVEIHCQLSAVCGNDYCLHKLCTNDGKKSLVFKDGHERLEVDGFLGQGNVVIITSSLVDEFVTIDCCVQSCNVSKSSSKISDRIVEQ